MRRLKRVSFIITCIFLFSIPSILAQERNGIWDFPLKPGMPEWKSLLSHKAMLDVCQVPVDILPTLSTERLVEICLSYPLFFTMTAFNNLQEGFEQVSTEFNCFQELFKRDDAAKILILLYQSLHPEEVANLTSPLERGSYKQKLFFTEFILSQKIIIDKCTEGEIRFLLSETLKKLDGKVKLKYSSFGTITTPLIMCRILENINYYEMENIKQRDDSYLIFSKSILLKNVNMIDELKTLTKNYLND